MTIVDAALQTAIRKYMRMATYKLSDQIRHNLSEIEALLFAAELTVKDHLKQQITQFFFEMNKILLLNRIYHFVSFFKRRRRDTGVILFDIPGAPGIRVTQASH